MLEGTFTLHEKQWIPLGKFRANNAFHEQEFLTERHVVRYLKLSILTSYGIWTYFTMTQLKVHGKGLFADAVASLEDSKRRKGREREFFLMADKQICGDDEDGDSENQL